MEDAVTAMFAEYAALYARIAGQVGRSVPPPLTMDEATSMSDQASQFINDYATPILGLLSSTKVHKLLRHVLDAIKAHGNLKHGNSAANEAMHKYDKPFYMRTTEHPETFTAQIVRQAQGSKALLERLAREDAAAECEAAASPHSGGRGAPGLMLAGDRAPQPQQEWRRRHAALLGRRPGQPVTGGHGVEPVRDGGCNNEAVCDMRPRGGMAARAEGRREDGVLSGRGSAALMGVGRGGGAAAAETRGGPAGAPAPAGGGAPPLHNVHSGEAGQPGRRLAAPLAVGQGGGAAAAGVAGGAAGAPALGGGRAPPRRDDRAAAGARKTGAPAGEAKCGSARRGAAPDALMGARLPVDARQAPGRVAAGPRAPATNYLHRDKVGNVAQ